MRQTIFMTFIFPAFVGSFQPIHLRRETSTSATCTYALFPEDNKEDSFEDFNPFERIKTSTPAPQILSSSTISLRKMRMQELMGKLINADVENDEIPSLLLLHEDLIMEPLEDDLGGDEDSIYELGMTREERFERYDKVMREREEKAVNKKVEIILKTMREFVMSRK